MTYKEVKIGKQIWMAQNLGVGTFRNGEPIPDARTDEEWLSAGKGKQPASCYYRSPNSVHDRPYSSTPSLYGRLYNWYSVNDPRGLAPEGWHIPTDVEWRELVSFLGNKNSGSKLKAVNNGWKLKPSTDDFGFSAFPSGNRINAFDGEGVLCWWWTSSSFTGDPDMAHWFGLDTAADWVIANRFWKDAGLSVRCIKD
jgi:uncharacterized protein (TIGR02145 family)